MKRKISFSEFVKTMKFCLDNGAQDKFKGEQLKTPEEWLEKLSAEYIVFQNETPEEEAVRVQHNLKKTLGNNYWDVYGMIDILKVIKESIPNPCT